MRWQQEQLQVPASTTALVAPAAPEAKEQDAAAAPAAPAVQASGQVGGQASGQVERDGDFDISFASAEIQQKEKEDPPVLSDSDVSAREEACDSSAHAQYEDDGFPPQASDHEIDRSGDSDDDDNGPFAGSVYP